MTKPVEQAQSQAAAPPPEVAPAANPPAANSPADNPAPATPVAEPQPNPPTVEQPGTASEPPHAAEVPTPLPKPAEDTSSAAPAPVPTPVPTPAPAANPDSGKPEATKPEADKPAVAPAGEPAPPAASQGEPAKEEPKAETPPPPPPIAKEEPEELKACLADLAALGTQFKTTNKIEEGEGCGIDQPINVAEVLPGVDTGGATMRCKTAQALGHWLKDTVQPALNIAMPGRKITGLVPGSTYACRLRNNASTGRISEHARGNAFDVAAFKLDNGDKIEMKPRGDDHTMEGAFQKTATAGACLYFTTVLAPGSDAAHEDHLHLDTMERNGDYRICE
ncbi:extensin family protein [Rhizobium deserti]|uniref:Extensin family protein n=2 Tax=Rhizobium deserti TaxID=2547961 RepID=A0A4R5UPA8_9HYPH|nr:extensin family protein [Rhizobium deserti]